MNVPFLDVAAATAELRDELDAAWARVRDSGWFIRGPELEAFESEWAAYVGVPHAVGVGNGLDALSLVLRAAGIGPGDEVLVPSHTYIATWLAVSAVGATPVPVEPKADTGLIDIEAAVQARTPRTRAVLPVHLYGQPVDIDAVRSALPDLFILEDAAQSQGATVRGHPAGGLGDAAGTSLYPGKNLGALGDAGVVTTRDADLAGAIRRLGHYGQTARYQHDVIGTNSRLDELQAAFLRVKLRHLDEWNARRARVAHAYLDGLRDTDLILPFVVADVVPVWHLFVVRHPRRDAVVAKLAADGVHCQIHYPQAVHRCGAYQDLVVPPLPLAERWADEVFSLPVGPHLTEGQVARVIARTRAALAN